MTKYNRRQQDGGNPPPRDIIVKDTRDPIVGSILPKESCPVGFTTMEDKCYICISPGVFNRTTKKCVMPCPNLYRDDGVKCYAPCPAKFADNFTDTCEPGYAKPMYSKQYSIPAGKVALQPGQSSCGAGLTKLGKDCYQCKNSSDIFDPTTTKCVAACASGYRDISNVCVSTNPCASGYVNKDFMCSCPAGFEQKSKGSKISCVAIQTSSASPASLVASPPSLVASPTSNIASPTSKMAPPPIGQYTTPAATKTTPEATKMTPAGEVNLAINTHIAPLNSFFVIEPSDYDGDASTTFLNNGTQMSLSAASDKCISEGSRCYGFVFETSPTETRSISQLYKDPTSVQGTATFKGYNAVKGRAVTGPLPASGSITKRFFEKATTTIRLDSSQTESGKGTEKKYTWPTPESYAKSIALASATPASGGGRKRTLRKKHKSGKKTSKAKRRK